jgi:cytochrome c biogenesis protein
VTAPDTRQVTHPDADEPLESTTLSTQPAPVAMPALGWVGLARWAWRQLTSMRTALVLLFLLALAAVPGSVFPQRVTDPGAVDAYLTQHPTFGPILDRLSMFDVFGSIWFSAIYLLLFVSVVGCVVPRTLKHAHAMRSRPPAAPRNLGRLPEHRFYRTAAAPALVLAAGQRALRSDRWRVDAAADSVAAEKGYLRETGNLVFHAALVVLLAGVAIGALFGTSGAVIVVQGTSFANTLIRYDSFSSGRLANINNLPPFSFTMTRFSASYQVGGPQNGAPRTFAADVTVRATPQSQPKLSTINVNAPLQIGGTKVFLIGHGYAPNVTVRDGQGRVVMSGAVPFLPQNGMFLSQGVIKVPDARPTQIGFRSVFLPTAAFDPTLGAVSAFPAADNPRLLLTLFAGNLGMDDGTPQSVYVLDTSQMTQEGGQVLAPGQTWVLPDHLGSITFDSVQQFASFSIAHDPGQSTALVGAVLALAGLMLSLFVRRRRIWVRATAQPDGTTLVWLGGLARAEAGGLAGEVDRLVEQLRAAAPQDTLTASDDDGPRPQGDRHESLLHEEIT